MQGWAIITPSSFHHSPEIYYPLILSFFFILQVPMIFGVIFGFLFLDEKDDRVLTLISVTPVSLDNYLRYRFLVTVLFSALYVMLTLPATGMWELALLPQTMPVAFLGGLFAVFTMLFLLAFANNKVEGLALMKGMGILMLGPLAACFIDPRWQWLLGLLPSYWPAKAFWMLGGGQSAWPFVMGGSVYIIILIALLTKRLRQKIDHLV